MLSVLVQRPLMRTTHADDQAVSVPLTADAIVCLTSSGPLLVPSFPSKGPPCYWIGEFVLPSSSFLIKIQISPEVSEYV